MCVRRNDERVEAPVSGRVQETLRTRETDLTRKGSLELRKKFTVEGTARINFNVEGLDVG